MTIDDQDTVAPRDVLAGAPLPPRVRNALVHVMSDVASALSGPLSLALHDAQMALRNAGPMGGDRRAQADHATSLDRLRTGVSRVQSRFLAQLEGSLARLREDAGSPSKPMAAPVELTLSLLDDEAASDEAMVEATASRAEVRNSLALQLLAHRLGVLAESPSFEVEDLPLGPHRLARAFVDAIAPLQLSRQAHVRLFEQFDAHVMTAYPAMLDVINATLAGQGILPHLSFIPVRPRASPDRRGPRPGGAEATARAHPDATPPRAGAGTATGGTPLQAPASPAVTGDDRFQALQALLHSRRQLLAKLRPASQPAALLPPLRSEALSQLLRGIRATPEPVDSLEQARTGVLERARQLQGHGVAMTQSDLDTFELLGLFFDHLQRELRDGSPGEVLLGRLRLPLLQLALRDHAFFVDPEHPARQLVDAVSLAGARWLGEDDLSPQWLAALQQAVEAVEPDMEAEPSTFARANRALQERLQVLARGFELSERRQVEAARGREKLAMARMHAAAQIARCTHGRELPKFESILLSQAWADVLALGHLRHVEGSEAWDALMRATARIVDRAAGEPDSDPDPALFGLVGTSLEQVGYHRSDAQAIAAQLTGCGSGATDTASRTGLLLQLRARARLGEGAPGEQAPAPLTPDAQAAFDRMKRPGARLWVEREEAPGHRVRRRLGWASGRTGQTLLLNRRGQRVPADELAVLARDVASGGIRLLAEDMAPAETAWRAMTSTLQRLAGGDGAAAGKEDGHGD